MKKVLKCSLVINHHGIVIWHQEFFMTGYVVILGLSPAFARLLKY